MSDIFMWGVTAIVWAIAFGLSAIIGLVGYIVYCIVKGIHE